MTTTDTHTRPSLLDQPEVMRSVHVIVEAKVLWELLDRAWLCAESVREEQVIAHLLDEVERGAVGLVTWEVWNGQPLATEEPS